MDRRIFLETILTSGVGIALVGCSRKNPIEPEPEPNPARLILVKNTFQFSNDNENRVINVKTRVQNIGEEIARNCYGMLSLYNHKIDGTSNEIISYEVFSTRPLDIRPNETGILETEGGVRYSLGKHRLGVLSIKLYPDPIGSNYIYNPEDGSIFTINY